MDIKRKEDAEKIELFKSVFPGRDDAHGEGDGLCVKHPVTDALVLEHLTGKRRIGRYPLSSEILDGAGTLWGVLDVDINDLNAAIEVLSRGSELGCTGYIERSKMKGFHAWFFFAEAVPAKYVIALLQYCNDGTEHEVFPKQTTIKNGSNYGYGNYINLPLYGADVPDGKTAFLDPDNGYEPHTDQWAFLAAIERITSATLDGLIESGELDVGEDVHSIEIRKPEGGTNTEYSDMLPCVPRMMAGVAEGCRDEVTFALAKHWRVEKDLPEVATLAILQEWNQKNSPPLSENEIQVKVTSAYHGRGGSGYTSYGCENVALDVFCVKGECSVYQKRRRVDPVADTGDVRGFKPTDMGNGERLAHYHGDKIRYCYPAKAWYIWDGSRWAVDRIGRIDGLAKDTVRKIYTEAGECEDDRNRDDLSKHARKSEALFRQRAMVTMAGSEPGIPVLPNELDADPWLLNCLNGTINLRTGELLPHQQSNLITKLAPVVYNPDAKFDCWDKFLHTVTDGNEEFMAFLQRTVGYTLTGDTGEEVLFFVHGPTATGKSTYVEAIKSVMGEYGTTADFEVFLKRYKDVGSPRNDVANLAGARLVVSIEVEEGKALAEGLVKMLTGGDTVRARFLYQESFEFIPQLKLWLCANHTPKIRANDAAMWRRVLRLPFEHIIPEAERDPSVKMRLKDAAVAGPAILAWAVEGCLRWQKYGLGVPNIVKEATEAYRKEMDILEVFVEECCVISESATVTKKELYASYAVWCSESGEKSEGKISFGKRLGESKYEVEAGSGKGNRAIWKGIGLLAKQSELDI